MNQLSSFVVMSMLTWITLSLTGTSLASDDDVFSSVAKMEGLVHQENVIVDLVERHLKASKLRHQILQR